MSKFSKLLLKQIEAKKKSFGFTVRFVKLGRESYEVQLESSMFKGMAMIDSATISDKILDKIVPKKVRNHICMVRGVFSED